MLTLAMLFFGLYALLTGEIPIFKSTYFIEAKHARIIGAICMSPFPLTIFILLVVGVLMAASGRDEIFDSLFWIGLGIELLAVIGCAAVAGVVSRVYRKPIVELVPELLGIAHQETRTISVHQGRSASNHTSPFKVPLLIGFGIAAGGCVCLALCCGGLLYFVDESDADLVREVLEEDPRFTAHMGQIQKVTSNFRASMASGPNLDVFDVEGTKWSGRITVKRDGWGSGEILWIRFKLPSGEIVKLKPKEIPIEDENPAEEMPNRPRDMNESNADELRPLAKPSE
jgi:hypothetical protein